MLATITLAILLASASSSSIPESAKESVLRQWLQPNSDFVYCLSIDGSDADAQLIQSLSHPELDLAAASECEAVTNPREGSFHRKSGQKALFIYLKDFRQTDANTAELSVETYHHGLWASGNTVRLQLNDGLWIPVETIPGWVS
ncbi:hypothetical protein [Pseudoxanthomonas japonensis]|uniref:hypothetical protein n=1 Tax=Pseudoxanthomonas japonensis TaxID=69284 RepID=UPI001BCB05B7|nr:hypothetical protein [Pseudoxanthomonas japonensis]